MEKSYSDNFFRLHSEFTLTTTMNSKQSELIEKYQDSLLKSSKNLDENESDDDDDLLDQLEREEEEVFSKYRESRMQELSKEFKKIDQLSTTDSGKANHELGELKNITNERELMDIIAQNQTSPIIIHFQEPNFTRCKIMNDKLCILAEKHLGIRFIVINASEAPFLVAKLNIKVLPFVVGYVNGKECLRIVGFEKLGNNPNDFQIESLEQIFYMNGIINRKTINFGSIKQKPKDLNQDSDDDLDI